MQATTNHPQSPEAFFPHFDPAHMLIRMPELEALTGLAPAIQYGYARGRWWLITHMMPT